MEVNQISTILNTALTETLGTAQVSATTDDLSQIVDSGKLVEYGTTIFENNLADKYVNSLINHIGKVIMVNRSYSVKTPSVLMDGWEYGSILEKIRVDLPQSTNNQTWNLLDHSSDSYNQDNYDPFIITLPTATAKFFNKMITYNIDMSFARRQVKQSFSGSMQLNAFFSMIEVMIKNRKTIDFDNLIMRTINNFIGATFYNLSSTGSYSGKSGSRAVNLLYLYNQTVTTSLSAEEAITTPEFIRFAVRKISDYSDYMERYSSIFNIGGTNKFTPKKLQHLILLSTFKNAANIYLQSSVFHDEYTRLPNSEDVPYWQGSGTDFSFNEVSSINANVITSTGNSETTNVSAGGILGVLFDRDALGVSNIEDRVESIYNPRAEYINNFYKSDARYFNDYDENFVVFYVA